MKTYSKLCIILSGLLMVVVGIIALCNPEATLASLSWVIGLMIVISGMSSLVFYFSAAKGFPGAGTVLFSGILDIVLGVIFLNNSYIMSKVLAFIAGLWLAAFGIEKIVRSFDLKKFYYSDWWITLIIGIAMTVLGFLSMIAPMAGAIMVSIVVGLGFILHGAALLIILHTIVKAIKANEPDIKG